MAFLKDGEVYYTSHCKEGPSFYNPRFKRNVMDASGNIYASPLSYQLGKVATENDVLCNYGNPVYEREYMHRISSIVDQKDNEFTRSSYVMKIREDAYYYLILSNEDLKVKLLATEDMNLQNFVPSNVSPEDLGKHLCDDFRLSETPEGLEGNINPTDGLIWMKVREKIRINEALLSKRSQS